VKVYFKLPIDPKLTRNCRTNFGS